MDTRMTRIHFYSNPPFTSFTRSEKPMEWETEGEGATSFDLSPFSPFPCATCVTVSIKAYVLPHYKQCNAPLHYL